MNALPKIKKKSGEPLASRLADHLRGHIKNNCSPGEKFLSERKLCEEFGLSRVTVGKAISSLVLEGILYQKHGSGTYIADNSDKLNPIALMVYHCDNPFYSKVVRSIQEEADKKGFQTMLINSKGLIENENAALKKIQNAVSGIILAPSMDSNGNISPELKQLIKSNFPLVVICHSGNCARKFNSVIPDSRVGGYAATEHLIKKGYKKILFFGISEIFDRQDIYDRFEGYRDALKEHGISFRKNWLIMSEGKDVFNGFFKDGCDAAEKIIPLIEKGTAVFSLGDSSAIGLMKGLREKGIRIPEDIGICGFDDIDLAAQWGIELTTVRILASCIGKEATRILSDRIKNKNPQKIENIISPVELVIRKTT
jgi:DNA-binding LacI/PurR family transcriptional regulator